MQVPPNDSVVWIYVRLMVLSSILLAFCEFAYHNHLAQADVTMILTAVGSIFGVDLFKHNFSAPSTDKTPDKE